MSGKAILKEIGSTLLYIVVVLGITWLVITFVGQRTEVNGSSMEPTLSNNDNLIVDKISYRFKDPQRFDIIVFPFQYDENVYYIKRIIGLPGETVQIGTDGTIYIDGQVLEEGYGKEVILSPGRAGEPITLGETNILCWAIIETTARTAGSRASEISTGIRLLEKRGSESGRFINLEC